MRKCSTTGPRASAGKKVNAPTMMITPTSSTTKSGVVTGNVPAVSGACFRSARNPASANIGTCIAKRPMSVASPSVVL